MPLKSSGLPIQLDNPRPSPLLLWRGYEVLLNVFLVRKSKGSDIDSSKNYGHCLQAVLEASSEYRREFVEEMGGIELTIRSVNKAIGLLALW